MAYIYDLADTWNASGTTFTAVKMNVTDTASASGSLLINLQVGGVSKFLVTKDGILNSRAAGFTDVVDVGLGFRAHSSGSINIGGTSGSLQFTSTNNFASPTDLAILRDAANTLGQRNGVNAQAFNLYNSYTDVSNYERGVMKWATNVLTIGTEKLGTGTARALALQTDGTTRVEVTASGDLRSVSGGIYNIRSGVTGVWYNFGGVNNYIGTESNHSFSIRSNNLNRLTFDTTGSVQVVTALTVATLPATPLVGMIARVTNALTPTIGTTVAGGGAAYALVNYNGANWTVIGV
jgi:hypothetical protein